MNAETPGSPTALEMNQVAQAIDDINTRNGWPRSRPEPCAGHMVSDHRPIDGISVATVGDQVEFRIGAVVVGAGNRWRGWGNAYVRCLLPHSSGEGHPVSAGLHQGGALNDFQSHLLSEHGTHRYTCQEWNKDQWCRLCRAA